MERCVDALDAPMGRRPTHVGRERASHVGTLSATLWVAFCVASCGSRNQEGGGLTLV